MAAVFADPTDEAAARRVYEALLQATPDLLYVFDLQHRFVYANEALLAMWGMSWEQARGKTCLEIGYEPWHAAMHDEEIERVIATRAPIRGDVPFPHKDKGLRVYDYIFTPVIGVDGQVEAIAGSTRDVTERKQHEERLQLLIHELNHRVKNSLSMVQSLVRQTIGNATMLEEAREKIEARLLALSAAHDVLTRESWHSAELLEIARSASSPFDLGEGGRFEMAGDPCRLEPRHAVALAMAFHELATNSTKYGALSTPAGRVRLSWHHRSVGSGTSLALRWEEYGGPPVSQPMRRGFGSRLLERGLKHDLACDAHLSFQPNGVIFWMVMPLPTEHDA